MSYELYITLKDIKEKDVFLKKILELWNNIFIIWIF